MTYNVFSGTLNPTHLLTYLTYSYARLVVVNWTFHVSIWLRTGDGRRAFAYAGPTSWNSLPDSLKDINLTLQTLQTPP